MYVCNGQAGNSKYRSYKEAARDINFNAILKKVVLFQEHGYDFLFRKFDSSAFVCRKCVHIIINK